MSADNSHNRRGKIYGGMVCEECKSSNTALSAFKIKCFECGLEVIVK